MYIETGCYHPSTVGDPSVKEWIHKRISKTESLVKEQERKP